jgi:hypothetical protein
MPFYADRWIEPAGPFDRHSQVVILTVDCGKPLPGRRPQLAFGLPTQLVVPKEMSSVRCISGPGLEKALLRKPSRHAQQAIRVVKDSDSNSIRDLSSSDARIVER